MKIQQHHSIGRLAAAGLVDFGTFDYFLTVMGGGLSRPQSMTPHKPFSPVTWTDSVTVRGGKVTVMSTAHGWVSAELDAVIDHPALAAIDVTDVHFVFKDKRSCGDLRIETHSTIWVKIPKDSIDLLKRIGNITEEMVMQSSIHCGF